MASFLVVCFCVSLRGNDGFMLDLSPIRVHLALGVDDPDGLEHVVICLLGRFKGETNTCWHMILLASETASGLNPRYWLEKQVNSKETQGITSGPAISDTQGFILPNSKIEEEFHAQLEWVQSHRPDLIPDTINVREDYGLFRYVERGGWLGPKMSISLSLIPTPSTDGEQLRKQRGLGRTYQ